MAFELILFYAFAAIAVGTTLLVVVQSNPVYSVLLLIGSFVGLSGLYVLLDAPFVAVIQIIVYAGAIMVLFLFVVMLLNAPQEAVVTSGVLESGATRVFGGMLAIALAMELAWALSRSRVLGDLRGVRHPPIVLGSGNWRAAVPAIRVCVRGDVHPDSRRHAWRGRPGRTASVRKNPPWLS